MRARHEPDSKVNKQRAEQSWKQDAPTISTEAGMQIARNEEYKLNADLPIAGS
jgi:hypothetical protein